MRVRVVAAVLSDATGRVLITQRPPGKPLAGYWEFPGGKVVDGETDRQALARELIEELGVQILRCEPWLSLRHAYPDREVDLEVYTVAHWRGEPSGLEGQALAWLQPRALAEVALLPADAPVVAALTAQTEALTAQTQLGSTR